MQKLCKRSDGRQVVRCVYGASMQNLDDLQGGGGLILLSRKSTFMYIIHREKEVGLSDM